MRQEMRDLKSGCCNNAELSAGRAEPSSYRKNDDRAWGRRGMRCHPHPRSWRSSAWVEQSHLEAVRSTLDKLQVPFRRPPLIAGTIAFWPLATAGLEDSATAAQAGCGTVSADDVQGADLLDLALEETQLSNARELAVRFTEHQGLLCLGSLGLPTSQGPRPDHQPRFRGHQEPPMSSATKTIGARPTSCGRPTFCRSQGHRLGLRSTFYLLTILARADSRYIIAWSSGCTNMTADDASDGND